MVKQYLLSIFSLVLLFQAQSQEIPAKAIYTKPIYSDSVAFSIDTVANLATLDDVDSTLTDTTVIRTWQPSIYLDYGKLFTIPTAFETKAEGGLELLFGEKIPLIVEVGYALLTPDDAFANGTYESTGMYVRLGGGYVRSFTPKNKIGLTFRYAVARFEDNARISLISPSGAQNNRVITEGRSSLQASWTEVVVYSDRKLSDLFSIGVNFRLRIMIDYDEQTPIDVYAIPGYGRTVDTTVPAANLFLKVSF